jgi:hypothetical protein
MVVRSVPGGPRVSEIAKRKAATGFGLALLFMAVLSGGAILRGQNSDRYERFRSGGYLNGLGWIIMSSEEKSTYLLGFEDGIRSGIGQAVYRKWLKVAQEDKLVAELLVRDRPGLDVEAQIDRIYKDDANVRLPIMLVYHVVKLDLTEEGVRMALEKLRKIGPQ